ncbi:MAG: YbaB/EbfC DNA-binding family [Streptosporangiaceae bacterium]|nr:YbaB/EbfC DNA-binding family protein [Streptosporangiaceae bacterium]MDX6431829.1 YbaB/EbfC DNA-binding family [Streptosporangiaceae bacterium]
MRLNPDVMWLNEVQNSYDRDMDFAKDLFEQAMRDVESQLGSSNGVLEEIQNLAVEAVSEDELIRATVGPPGFLQSLELDPRVKRLDVETLAEQIMEMVNGASDLLRTEMAERVQALMPDLDPAKLMAEFTQSRETDH